MASRFLTLRRISSDITSNLPDSKKVLIINILQRPNNQTTTREYLELIEIDTVRPKSKEISEFENLYNEYIWTTPRITTKLLKTGMRIKSNSSLRDKFKRSLEIFYNRSPAQALNYAKQLNIQLELPVETPLEEPKIEKEFSAIPIYTLFEKDIVTPCSYSPEKNQTSSHPMETFNKIKRDTIFSQIHSFIKTLSNGTKAFFSKLASKFKKMRTPPDQYESMKTPPSNEYAGMKTPPSHSPNDRVILTVTEEQKSGNQAKTYMDITNKMQNPNFVTRLVQILTKDKKESNSLHEKSKKDAHRFETIVTPEKEKDASSKTASSPKAKRRLFDTNAAMFNNSEQKYDFSQMSTPPTSPNCSPVKFSNKPQTPSVVVS